MAKILLVEDDKSLREIYGVRLMAEGYEIVSAGDGEEALAMAIKERPDLIVSDVMMPKISGFDMLDILRSTTETKNVKVIMMTALSSEDQRARGEALGADRYLVKSQVGIEDVVRTVHDVLGDAIAPAAPMFTSTPQAPAPLPVPPPITAAEPAPSIAPPVFTPGPAPQPAAPIEPPVFPEPVAAPAPIPAAPSYDPTSAAAPAPDQQFAQPVADPVAPPAYAQPSAAPAQPPVFTQPIPPAPAPDAQFAQPSPQPQPYAAPAAPAQAPQYTAPEPVAMPAPMPSAMPQPTAPFSSPAPASLGERIIAPLTNPAAQAPNTLDVASQMDQALNTLNNPQPNPPAPGTPPAL